MATKKLTRGVRKVKKSVVRKTKKAMGTKKAKKGSNIVDIGTSRQRVIGSPGMGQNLSTTKELAKSMALSNQRAKGAANSLALGLGAALA